MSEKYKAFTDDELVTMARNGDVDAEEYLIQKYQK